jgi:hypothetical protein
MKVLFTVKPKDRNDLSATSEFEAIVPKIKKGMISGLGKKYEHMLETSFDQSSVLYPKMFMFDYESSPAKSPAPLEVITSFFKAIDKTGICLSKYDVHIKIEWI